jgi:hypothetical protein
MINVDFEVLRKLVTETPTVNGRRRLRDYMELMPLWTLRKIIG